jgi:bifunctional non-homologous end joining protein LigD
VKTQQSEDSWLLIKHHDVAVDEHREITDDDASVVSSLTVAELKAGHLPDRSREATPARLGDLPGAKRAKPPARFAPMLATATADAFSSEEWLFEPKLDGIRALALVDGESVALRSRTGRPITDQYPSPAAALARQPAGSMLLDGEIVALDERGVPSFEVLQQRMNLLGSHNIERAEADVPVIFFAFDLLYLDGYDLRRVPLRHRKAMLARTLLPTARVQAVEHFERDGKAAYEAVQGLGFEGIVAKRADSKYEGGKCSRNWLKVKATQSDEFVVVGFSPGNGARASTFGSLLLGTRNDDGELISAGRVGGGFDDATLTAIRRSLDRITRKTCPLPGGAPDDAGDATWVTPRLVVEVEFAQWTNDGHLRAPVF